MLFRSQTDHFCNLLTLSLQVNAPEAASISANAWDACDDVLSQVMALVNAHFVVLVQPVVGVVGLTWEAVVPSVLFLTVIEC